jgi:hypothetical protein
VILAEELTLLSLDPDGAPARGGMIFPMASFAVTLLLVLELVEQGLVELDDDLQIRCSATRARHVLLEAEHRFLRRHQGDRLGTCLAGSRHVDWRHAVGFLVASGELGRRRRWLRRPLHPPVDADHHAALRWEVRQASLDEGPLTDRLAVLLTFGYEARLPVVPFDVLYDREPPPRIVEARRQMPLAATLVGLVTGARPVRLWMPSRY